MSSLASHLGKRLTIRIRRGRTTLQTARPEPDELPGPRLVTVRLLVEGRPPDEPIVLLVAWYQDGIYLLPPTKGGRRRRDPDYRPQMTLEVAPETAERLLDPSGRLTVYPGWLGWSHRNRGSRPPYYHREDGPIFVSVTEDGVAKEEWLRNDRRGRVDDEPALTVRRRDGSKIEAFYHDGLIDRDPTLGPAVIVHHADGRRTETFVERCLPVVAPDGSGPRRTITYDGAVSSVPVGVWCAMVTDPFGEGSWATCPACIASDDDRYELMINEYALHEARPLAVELGLRAPYDES
jgi:hypothetical protein